MSLLTTVQRFCRRTNITTPTTVIGTSDAQIAQIYALLEEEGNDLSGRGSWNELTREATLTTTATESQGNIEDIGCPGFRYIKNDTIWDRTENTPVVVIDGPDWQAEKGFATTSPRYRARVRGGELIVTPTPVAGNTWAFEYVTWNWINGGAKQYFTADTDSIDLPEPILMMGLRWRWKKEKGFEYAEDFRTYEKLVNDALSRDGLKSVLYQDQEPRNSSPKIVVNDGNWPL
jgi:hypothetical protein